MTETSETSIDSQKVTGIPPEPSESAIHGREVHVAKQKQTQKEVCIETLYVICTFLVLFQCTAEKDIVQCNVSKMFLIFLQTTMNTCANIRNTYA